MSDELKNMLQSVLNNSLQPIQEELKHMNKRVGGIESDLQILKDTTARIESKQLVIFDQTGKLSEYHTEVKNGLEDIKDRLNFNTHKLTETELEIFKLKKN